MRYIYIDGNNLIGKTDDVKDLQKNDRQGVREKLALKLERGLKNSKHKVILFFDGFPGPAIKAGKIKIKYSNERTADEIIKQSIELHNNPKLITLVTSDLNLKEFGKVCSCETKSSEKFAMEVFREEKREEEKERIKGISNEDIKKLFGV